MQNLFGYTTKENTTTHMDYETLNNIREDIAGELHAINDYTTHMNMTTNDTLKRVWTDIRNEEIVHIGMLINTLCHFDANFKEYFDKGVAESNNIINRR